MKFCVVGPAYPFRGGIAHHTTLLSGHLAERHNVDVATYRRLYPSLLFPGKSQLDPSNTVFGIPAIPMIDSMNPRTWIDTGKYIHDLRSDVVLFQWWHPFFGPCLASIASRARKQSKVMFVCHNVLPHDPTPLSRPLTLWALKHGDGFIVHSEKDLDDLRGLLPGISEDAMRKTIHPQYEFFPDTGMTKEEARARLGINGRVVLFFGLVRKYKGLMDLIEAMPLLKNRDITCLVAGEFYDKKSTYDTLIDRLNLNGRLRIFDRYVPNEEVEQYFAAVDAVVLPYRTATQSGIVQMAFRYAKPVISTLVGGIPEAIDDGRTGLLVPPGDRGSLARAIDRYFDESLEPTFSANIRNERGRFSWDRVVNTIESLGVSV